MISTRNFRLCKRVRSNPKRTSNVLHGHDATMRSVLLSQPYRCQRAHIGIHSCQLMSSRLADLRSGQAAETGDLDVVRRVLSLVPKDLDEATGRALSTCNYATVLGQAFG